jgi:hypothetical protein
LKRSQKKTISDEQGEQSIKEATPILSFKKRAILESDNESTTIFSDENPFQTPQGGLKTKKLSKKFTPSKIEIPDEIESVDVQFSPAAIPAFKEETPTTLSNALSKKTPSIKSPPSSRKKSPKKIVEISETPSKPTSMISTPTRFIIPQTPVQLPFQSVQDRKESLEERLLKRKRAKESSYFARKIGLAVIGLILSIFDIAGVKKNPK